MKKKGKKEKIPVEHAKCVWGLLCSISSIDQERNNISLFNVIEQFNIPIDFFTKQKEEGKPLLAMYPHEVVLCWRRTLDIAISNEEILADSKIKTVDPSGKILHETLAPLKFPSGIKTLRSRFIMQGIMASSTGMYVHQVQIKLPNQDEFKTVLEIPFEITTNA